MLCDLGVIVRLVAYLPEQYLTFRSFLEIDEPEIEEREELVLVLERVVIVLEKILGREILIEIV